MSINNLKYFRTDELLKQFKEATTFQVKPPQELADELQKRSGIAFINATDCAKVTLEKACAAIAQSQKSNRTL